MSVGDDAVGRVRGCCLGGAGERGFRSMVVMIRVFRFTRKGILVIVVMLVLVTVRGGTALFLARPLDLD